MNFIRRHIESSIWIEYDRNRHIASGGFIYLDSPADIGHGKKVNRIKDKFAYCSEEIVPCSWELIPGMAMMRISEDLKAGRFYGYKKIDGKSYKIRKKR